MNTRTINITLPLGAFSALKKTPAEFAKDILADCSGQMVRDESCIPGKGC
jgi:hypothetical protein